MTAFLGVRDILFPTDFSDVSRHAGTTAADIGRHFGARVHVLHVSRPGEHDAAGALEAAAAELGPGVDAITHAVPGPPARSIVRYAVQANVDLIVMGTHGRTGFSHALLGSVAEGVVRLASCRVLTVPARVAVHEVPSAAAPDRCVVCTLPSADLICQGCRAIIRGQAGAEHAAARPSRP